MHPDSCPECRIRNIAAHAIFRLAIFASRGDKAKADRIWKRFLAKPRTHATVEVI